MKKEIKEKGSVLLLVIVFGAILFLMLSAFASLVLARSRAETSREVQNEAFYIAEAGLNRYSWILAHSNTDPSLLDINTHSGEYTDSSGIVVGTYSISSTVNKIDDEIQFIDAISTGYSSENTSIRKTLMARYTPIASTTASTTEWQMTSWQE